MGVTLTYYGGSDCSDPVQREDWDQKPLSLADWLVHDGHPLCRSLQQLQWLARTSVPSFSHPFALDNAVKKSVLIVLKRAHTLRCGLEAAATGALTDAPQQKRAPVAPFLLKRLHPNVDSPIR